MANFFIGQISIFSFQFAPKSFAQANGQVLAISQNQALFSLLGTTYGGNGVTTFQLPNLEGRVAISSGGGPGLSSYQLGETGGQESHTLQTTEMPAHAHQVAATTTAGTLGPAAGNVLAGSPMYRNAGTSAQMIANSVANAGGNQPHENRQPFLTINFCIALQGIFPSRN